MNSIYILTTGDGRTADQLAAAGKYGWVTSLAELCVDNMLHCETFRLVPKTPKAKVVLELVEFQHEPTGEEVLAEFARQGLERPTREDALYFGEQYPEVQRKFAIAFLHQAWGTSGGSGPWAFTLDYHVRRGRGLTCGWFGRGGWEDVRRFAARRCCLAA